MEPTRLHGVFYKSLAAYTDDRGSLMELFRMDWLLKSQVPNPVMGYMSWTQPQVSRGPHEHKWQTDILIFPGPGSLLLRLADNRVTSPTRGDEEWREVGEREPMLWIVPPGIIHGYQCISDTPALSLNCATQLYKGWLSVTREDCVRHEDKGLTMGSPLWVRK